MKYKATKLPGFHPSILFAGVALLVILFVCVAYFFFVDQASLSPDQETALVELRERRIQWELKRPPAFRYQVERSCECPLDYTEPFDVVEYLDDPANHPWIDEYFIKLETAMLEGEVVAVRYNPRFDFPNDFTIGAEDIFIRDFEVLEYADESP